MRIRRHAEPSLAETVAAIEQRLHIVSAMAETLGQSERLMQVLASSEDAADACTRLRAQFGLDEMQALAVLDTQFRSSPRREVDKLREYSLELEDELRSLRDELRRNP